MCPSLNEAGEFNSLNKYACLRERVCVYVRGTEKERELVSVCVCVSRGLILYTIVLECVRERECVC